MVAKTRAGGQNSPKKLKFNDKLVNRGLSTDALLKKLKALQTELAEMDQELVDVNLLGSVRKELVSTSILLHKDRGVKAYAACCLADILRLYAPDAPYTHTELRDIFTFFFRQLLDGLTGSDASYYDEFFQLLESLSTVKSVVLVCDLPHAEELMVNIFRDCFTLARRDLVRKLEMFLADILVVLIDECQVVPGDVLEALMSQFMDKNAKMDQPAYRLAVQVCNATADKLQRHVCQYFTDIIVSGSRDEEFDDVRTAHDLIKQLNRSCPALLRSVVPQLEEELRVEEIQLRQIVTQVLGDMFSDKGGGDLVKKFPSTWNLWLNRKNDKSALIRLKLVEATRGLLVSLPEQRDAVEDALKSKLMDPDEKVRAAVCKVYSQLDYETALHHVSVAQLQAVAGRCADKKQHVRAEALNSLGKLYSLAYPEIEINDPAAIEHFAWIPNEILHMVSIGPEVKLQVEQFVGEDILPMPPSPVGSKGNDVDEVAWTDRLLNVMKYLDDGAIKPLLTLSGLKVNRPSVYEHYIQCCVQNNGGIIDENEEATTRKLAALTQHLAGAFPDPQKASDDLNTFAKLNEARLYKLAKTCMDPQTDLKNLVKATNEFLRRLEQSSASIIPTMSAFLRRASLRYVNQTSIPTLVKRLEQGLDATGHMHLSAQHARTWLSFISKHCPLLYKAHVGELHKAIADEENIVLAEVCLQALSALVRSDPKLGVWDKRGTERIMRYAMSSNHRHAKFAARLLAFSKDRERDSTIVVESIADSLSDADSELLAAHTAALSQFARFSHDAFESKGEVIMTFLLQKVLTVPTMKNPDTMDADDDWYEDDDVPPELRARVACLKICRNRCLAHSGLEAAMDVFKPISQMMLSMLEHGGSFGPGGDDDARAKARLHLQVAVSLLHLSTFGPYANAIAPRFVELAVTIQHPIYQVRISFLAKLISLLTPRKLPPRFNVIPFLTVHDPEADVKNTAMAYVSHLSRSLSTALKVEHLEVIFVRLLHLLAHHPDFSLSHDQLLDMAQYIDFYLDLIASADTVSLLFYLATKMKTVRDADHAFSENLYAISELAQELIKTRAHAHGWSIQSYPGKVKLPSDILKPLPSAEVANKILKTIHLPEETATWLSSSAKAKTAAHPKEKKKTERKPSGSKRKAGVAKRNGDTKRSKPSKRWQSDQSDEEEEPSASESSDVDMSPPKRQKAASASEKDESEKEEQPGRGTRTRAKRKQGKAASKQKAKSPLSDD